MLLYGIEIWVMTDTMMTVLYRFHNRISRRIAGTKERKGDSREWELASVYADLETTGIWAVREYGRRRKEKILEYVAGIPIYKLFTGSEWMEGSIRFLR